jgi:DNA end-binding protein Ku
VWELINAKLEHRKPSIVAEEPGTAKVINIMDALKKSVKAQGKQAAPGKAQGKRAAASRSSAKKPSRATPKRKSA